MAYLSSFFWSQKNLQTTTFLNSQPHKNIGQIIAKIAVMI